MKQFRRDLAQLINSHSLENGSNSPDFVLAQFLTNCLEAFNLATHDRDHFYSINPKPGLSYQASAAGTMQAEPSPKDEPAQPSHKELAERVLIAATRFVHDDSPLIELSDYPTYKELESAVKTLIGALNDNPDAVAGGNE